MASWTAPLVPLRVVFQLFVMVAAVVADLARPGDLVLTLGAGDVTLIGPEILELLAARTRS